MATAAGCGSQSLLDQLDCLLDSDPLIDELGFLHSSQIASLAEVSLESPLMNRSVEKRTILACEKDTSASQTLCIDRTNFWCANHKLAISVSVLPSLYEAAKSTFILTRCEYGDYLKSGCNASLSKLVDKLDQMSDCYMHMLRDRIMKYSRILIIISSDYKSAWNARREILAGRMTEDVLAMELRLSSLALSCNPKSEESWAYRRWAITQLIDPVFLGKIPENIIQGEFKLFGNVVERSKMNYRAWHHCYWLVQHLSPLQVMDELQRWKVWAQLHFADNCCWHFRRSLFQHLADHYNYEMTGDATCVNDGKDVKIKNEERDFDHVSRLEMCFQDELEWNKSLLKTYVGCEALWIHRRFLFDFWLLHIRSNILNSVFCLEHELEDCKQMVDASDYCGNWCYSIPKEMEFVNSCIVKVENSNDAHRQQVLAATYYLWILLKLRSDQHFSTENIKKELVQLEDILKSICPRLIDLWKGLFENINV